MVPQNFFSCWVVKDQPHKTVTSGASAQALPCLVRGPLHSLGWYRALPQPTSVDPLQMYEPRFDDAGYTKLQ